MVVNFYVCLRAQWVLHIVTLNNWLRHRVLGHSKNWSRHQGSVSSRARGNELGLDPLALIIVILSFPSQSQVVLRTVDLVHVLDFLLHFVRIPRHVCGVTRNRRSYVGVSLVRLKER